MIRPIGCLQDSISNDPDNLFPAAGWDLIWQTTEIATHILSNLPFEDVLSFECAAKRHVYVTTGYWKHMKSTPLFGFEWRDSPTYSFLLCKAIHSYVCRMPLVTDPQRFYQSFVGLGECFPTFGAYLRFSSSFHLKIEHSAQEIKKASAVLNTLVNENTIYGGDYLLRALYLITIYCMNNHNTSLQKIGIHLTKAIQLKATCASLFASLFLYTPRMNLNYLYTFGVLSVGQKDYRALHHLLSLNHDFRRNLNRQGVRLFPVSACEAMNNPTLSLSTETERLFLNIINTYDGEPPIDFLYTWWDFIIKFPYRNPNSYSLYSLDQSYLGSHPRNSNSYDTPCPFHRSFLKFSLGKWEEAEQCFDKLDPSRPSILFFKGIIKTKLEKWIEAEEIYEIILKLSNEWPTSPIEQFYEQCFYIVSKTKVPYAFWLDYGNIKLKLKKYAEAVEIFEKMLHAYEPTSTSAALHYSRTFSFRPDKHRSICEKISEKYQQENLTPPKYFNHLTRVDLSNAEYEFYEEKWNEVISLLAPLALNESLRQEDKVRLGYAYLAESKFELAEPIYDELVCIDSQSYRFLSRKSLSCFESVPMFFADIAFLKIKCGKSEEAYKFCMTWIRELFNALSLKDREKILVGFIEKILDHCNEITISQRFRELLAILHGEFEAIGLRSSSLLPEVPDLPGNLSLTTSILDDLKPIAEFDSSCSKDQPLLCAYSYFNSGKWDNVIAILHPFSFSIMEMIFLGYSYLNKGQWELAEPFYDRLFNGIENEEDNEYLSAYTFSIDEIHQEKIQNDCFFIWKKQWGASLKEMTHANYSEFLFDLVYIKMKLNKFDEAFRYCTLFIELHEDTTGFDSLEAIEGVIEFLKFFKEADRSMSYRLSTLYQRAIVAKEEWDASDERSED